MDKADLAGLYFGAVNFIAFVAFAFDKERAIRGGRRVPESKLLTYAAIGGSPGALIARRMLRHKTRKQPFVNRLRLIVGVQVAALVAGLLAVNGLLPGL
ncbi:DUF1294 domain-containing protein [Novosphingobium sp. ST904]|uniref:DUF1294 domain-containing protein n=1 Tax=Novosphingobium sp. ST904 TaxID=1684385 RepID=UPI0006C84369|nr:DUF1294 domain-containing protein [Novosphingobium sp. ST904]KPH65960.1 hypothetical protein ADT71_08860 [Novosphingobium sp. ST904]TCM38480.1 uncharacterized membrane protein YsdA (DUF1294 family) [Novosphingobium sp. ST904]